MTCWKACVTTGTSLFGTTWTHQCVKLPVKNGFRISVPVQISMMENTLQSTPKVLVVDDSPSIVLFIEKVLKSTGYHIIKAYDGEEGLQKALDEFPDLIVLDIEMPKMDGLTVCKKLKENKDTRIIPVIMLTSRDYIEDRITGLETGADDYITKPFNPKELLVRIKGMVERNILQHQKAEDDKLYALEQMAEEVAHEIRNPVVAIGGFARRITNKLPQDDPLKVYADYIVQEAQRLETMVNEIVRLKTLVVSPHTFIDIHRIINRVLDKTAADLQKRSVTLEKIFAENIPLIRGDTANLELAVYNIVENAMEALEKGGVITVQTAFTQQQVFIKISDSGKGIPEQEINQVVRPFYTSKMSGTGMGLTMVKHIIGMHGGMLALSSKTGSGTHVTITLPLRQRAA